MGTHSLANVYEYLLKAYGDASRAKADFMRFLSGDLPCPMLEAASDWISEEQGNAPGRGHAQRARLRITICKGKDVGLFTSVSE
jgi:hypothetical protein